GVACRAAGARRPVRSIARTAIQDLSHEQGETRQPHPADAGEGRLRARRVLPDGPRAARLISMASVAPVRWTPAALAQACVQQPTRGIPADDGPFRARKGLWKLAVRTGRRQLLLASSGQLPLLRQRIDPAWRRLLWVHEGMPQIGDALMDLAPRSLLVEHGA